jgi:hypothetical protein
MTSEHSGVFDDGAAAPLARIKQEAVRRGIAEAGSAAVTERDLLAQAAAGMAERRAARGDLVGGVIWGAIAAEHGSAGPEAGESEAVHAVPVPQDGNPLDQAGKNR